MKTLNQSLKFRPNMLPSRTNRRRHPGSLDKAIALRLCIQLMLERVMTDQDTAAIARELLNNEAFARELANRLESVQE
jgi:hypothetical protein